MISFELNWILRDIDNTLYYNSMAPFSLEWKEWLQKQYNEQFKLIKPKVPSWKPRIYNAIQRQISNKYGFIIYSREADFIYVMIEIIVLFYKDTFDYRLYDYCEQRLRHKTDERNFLYYCFRNVRLLVQESKNELCKDILLYGSDRRILRELFLCDPPEKYNRQDLKRMLSNIKYAYEAQIILIDDDYEKEVLTYYVSLLIKEVKKQWAILVQK